MDEGFVRQIEIMTERSLHYMGPLPPSPTRVKEDPSSPSHHRVKPEPASTLLPEGPVSLPCRRYGCIDATLSPPRRHRLTVK